MVSRLEQNSPALRYVTVADDLQQQIESGVVKDGDKLPSQHTMARTYGVSLTTLRAALELLEQRGYVRSAHGLGTFATAPTAEPAGNVLVVDDDPQILELLSTVLEGEDLQVTTAETAATGIDAMVRADFQAIFLDLIMPGGNGIELLKELETRDLKTPVVVVTGVGDSKLIDEAMELGPVTLLRKPIQVKQVRRVLNVLGVSSN